MSDELRDLRDATRARPEALARVKAGAAQALDPADVKALLRTVPGAPSGAAGRIKANLAAKPPVPPSVWPRVAGIAGGLLGAVGVVLVALPTDRPVALDLADGQRVVVAGLTVDADGYGALSGSAAAPVLDWESGEARLSADDLWIRTREAEARLVAQAAVVRRDVHGTTVTAGAAALSVRCLARDDTRDVSPGGTVTCPPVSRAGMLGRARAETAAGLPPAVVLATVEEALTRPPSDDDVLAELLALRLQLLVEDGRAADALSEARVYLAAGHSLRRADVQHLAAALALTLEGCDGARPHLEALAPTSPEAADRLAACAAGAIVPAR